MTDRAEVTGTGAASAVPDVVVVDTRVQAPDVAAALVTAAEQVPSTLQAAADLGVAATDRRTTGTGVPTRCGREGRAVVGYTAHRSARLTVRDRGRGRVGDVIGARAAVEVGGGMPVEAGESSVATSVTVRFGLG